MVKLLVLCFLVGNIAVEVAMASDKTEAAMIVEQFSNGSPKEAPSVVVIRKLGPSMAPESEEKWRSESHSVAEEKHYPHAQHSSSIDKSIAGGGVILGGLATTFLVSIFCYIRATARSHHSADSPSSP